MKEQIQSIQDLLLAGADPKVVSATMLDVMALMATEIEDLKKELVRLKELGAKSGSGSQPFSIG